MYQEPNKGATHPHGVYTPQHLIDESMEAISRTDIREHEVSCDQLLRESEAPVPLLLEPFFQQTGLACLAGSSDTGKSALLRQLALDIAGGATHWLGFPLHVRHRSVVYIATEDGRDATRSMVQKQALGHYASDLSGLRFIFEYDDLLGTLHRNLTLKPADLVIVDCFSDVYGDDLKDTQKIRAFLQPFQDLSQRHQCLVLFLHHTGKRTESLTPSKNNLLSGQGFEAKMRLVIELRADQTRPHDRHMCIVKGNYLPTNQKKESHVLHFDEATLRFSHTGGRVPHELLSRGLDGEEGKAKYEQAVDLKKEGYTHEQIAEMLGYAHKSSITDLFKKGKKLGWDNTEEGAEE